MPNGDVQDFYNDYKKGINRLEELNSDIIREKPFITVIVTVILLSAIQDENYDMVRNFITKNPTKGANEILEEIHQRRITLSSFDTSSTALTTRRSKVEFGNVGNSKPDKHTPSTVKKWAVPFIPMRDLGIFNWTVRNNILKWRMLVNKNQTQR